MEQPDISVAIVAYNALDKLIACLDSLARQEGLSVETILVDNASAEPVAETVRDRYPWVELIAGSTNLGFAGGTNRAVAAATGRLVLLLNPDTVLPEPDILARLRDRFDATPSLGALGCRLKQLDGTDQPLPRQAPRVQGELLAMARLPRWYRRPAVTYEGDGLVEVEYVTGAALLTTAAIWAEVGGLDEGYFMYFEDVDWCFRARAAGYRCAVTPEVIIQHHEGASYGGRQYVRREHYLRSLIRFVRRQRGRTAAGLLRAGLVVLTLVRLVRLLWDRSEDHPARRNLWRAQLRLGLTGR